MKLLLRLEKGEKVKYISHLDMQRLFQRALRRAKLPCAYSQGFNPHMLVSFACALPVGVCSKAEYAEVVLERFVPPTECMARLNEVLPDGVKILNACEPKDTDPTVGSVIALAEYSFMLKDSGSVQDKLDSMLKKEEILIEKKTKKGFATVNVRNMIHSVKQKDNMLYATLSCSNSENLRADKFREILLETGIETFSAVREKLFIISDGTLKEPLETE